MAIPVSNNLPPDKGSTYTVDPGKNQTVPLGSVFLNNTTYAGCDIKVMIHMYDSGQEAKAQMNTTDKDMEKTSADITKAWNDYNMLKGELATLKPGTQQFYDTSTQMADTWDKVKKLQETQTALSDKRSQQSRDLPSQTTKVLAECQTLSVSIFRDKRAVRSCGSVYPKAFTRGPREISGSLIFTVFDQHVVWDMLQAHSSDFDGNTATGAIMDQMPPVDIIVTFANEYGSLSRMAIFGVEFMSEGQTMSIEDLLTENVVSWVARDFDPMRKVGSRVKTDGTSAYLTSDFASQKASDLLSEDDYQNFQKDSPYDRFIQRRNPFI
jgi:hypothetical protein